MREPVMIEYAAHATSALVNGEVRLTIGSDALEVVALFDSARIPFADINAIGLADYTVSIKTDEGDYSLSRLGNWCRPFYEALYDSYNKAVLRSLFIKDTPLFTANGVYKFVENGINSSGSAPIHIYENSVVALPPDLSARRVPLCFVGGMDKQELELTLKLDMDERYAYSRLGYDTAMFAATVEKQIRQLREKSLNAVKAIDTSLSMTQSSQIAGLMSQGAAAQYRRLASIAPSFTAAIDNRIAGTCTAEYYNAFKEMSDPGQIYIGFKESVAEEESEEALPCQFVFWMIVPSPDGKYAAVEFAEEDSATFVYRTGGDFEVFARKLNRALEAIDFKREIIWMSDEQLSASDNAYYRMAAKRTAALRYIRSNFSGRIIHSNVESWKKRLSDLWK